MSGALDGLTVLELAEDIAGPYCGKLFAGLGAEVIKVEPPEGDRARRAGPFPNDQPDTESSGRFLYLNIGKKSVTLDIQDRADKERFLDLARSADVLFEDRRPGQMDGLGLSYSELSLENPGLVMVSITPFGQHGPYRDYVGTNMVVHAISGEMHLAGSRGMPLKKGGHLAEYHGGMHAFIGALAALFARDKTGRGQHVDVALVEAVTAILGASVNSWLYNGQVSSRSVPDPWSQGTAAQRGADGKHWGPSGAWKTRDGHVLAYGRASADWNAMFRDIAKEVPEFGDAKYQTQEGRDAHVRALSEMFGSWISGHTKEEVYLKAQHYGHAYGYVATAPDLLASPQLAARGFFVELDHPVTGKLLFPGAPFVMSKTPFQISRAPLLGEHNDSVFSGVRRKDATAQDSAAERGSSMPLEGVRVLDFTHVWAGPYCTRLLGDLGAEVIKVESITRGDGGRGKGTGRFHAYSRNKLALTLDLRTDEGAALIRRLIPLADVVVENFSVGVMKRLGIDYEDCVKMRPDIVYLALPAFGRTGPEAGYVGMGATQEAMSGLLGITGHPDALPQPTGVKYGDPNGGVTGAVAALSALWYRRVTGEGQLVDLSQREANVCLLPEPVFEYTMNRRIVGPTGNRHPRYAPRGCYPCTGEDMWVAVDVETDEQFRVLCDAIGRPELADDARFADIASRKQHEDELDDIIETWTCERGNYEVMDLLQRAGVPAGAVLTNQQLLEDPHFRARGFFKRVDHPDVGIQTHIAFPARLSETSARVRRFAPTLGQHNDYVLGELLGLSASEIAELAEKKVIGTKPLPKV